jgi:RHS repeat-associated protein
MAWSDEFTPFGSAADSENKPDGGFKFASYEYDEDVQLNYALARWQDPETGRFTSLDPARDGVNWYVYAANNPIRYFDPTGLYDAEQYDNGIAETQRISDAYDAKEYNNPGSINSGNFYDFLSEVRITHNVDKAYNFYDPTGNREKQLKNEFIDSLVYLYRDKDTKNRIEQVTQKLIESGAKITITYRTNQSSEYELGKDKSHIIIYWDSTQGMKIRNPENETAIRQFNPSFLSSAAIGLGHELAGHGFQDLVENKFDEIRTLEGIAKDPLSSEKQRQDAIESIKDILRGPKDPRGIGPWPERTGGLEQEVVDKYEKSVIKVLNEQYGAHEAIRTNYEDGIGWVNTSGVRSTREK